MLLSAQLAIGIALCLTGQYLDIAVGVTLC